MKSADKLTTAEALDLAEQYGVSVSKVTMNEWCKPYPEGRGIGIKVAGRWQVKKRRLMWLLEGKEWKIRKEAREEAE